MTNAVVSRRVHPPAVPTAAAAKSSVRWTHPAAPLDGTTVVGTSVLAMGAFVGGIVIGVFVGRIVIGAFVGRIVAGALVGTITNLKVISAKRVQGIMWPEFLVSDGNISLSG